MFAWKPIFFSIYILGMLPDSNNRYKPQGYAHVNEVSSINNEESSIFYDCNSTRNGTRRKPLHRLCKFVFQNARRILNEIYAWK